MHLKPLIRLSLNVTEKNRLLKPHTKVFTLSFFYELPFKVELFHMRKGKKWAVFNLEQVAKIIYIKGF